MTTSKGTSAAKHGAQQPHAIKAARQRSFDGNRNVGGNRRVVRNRGIVGNRSVVRNRSIISNRSIGSIFNPINRSAP